MGQEAKLKPIYTRFKAFSQFEKESKQGYGVNFEPFTYKLIEACANVNKLWSGSNSENSLCPNAWLPSSHWDRFPQRLATMFSSQMISTIVNQLLGYP